jgi:hypothetical protein
MRTSAAIVALLFAASVAPATGADDVTIYRCTDGSGGVTFRDTPCRKGQAQQTRTMVRPKDAPVTKAAPPPPVVADAPARAVVRVVQVHTPRPLYECVPPEGDAYIDDSPEGHPRWVPLWTLGYPYVVGLPSRPIVNPRTDGHVASENRLPGRFGFGEYGAGMWVRDDCHALPQADVCARLIDRRDAIRTRFFNAMPSERDTLRVEERSINARLDEDCG